MLYTNKDGKLMNVESVLKLLPEPPKTRIFSMGDRVTLGNLKEVYIIEVLHNNKIYKVEYIDVNHNYGNPIETPGATRFITWLDVLPYISPKDNKKIIRFMEDEDIFLNALNTVVESSIQMKYFIGINFNPPYQRDYVWDIEDKRNLLDSIFQNIDIGKLVFRYIEIPEWSKLGYGYEIVDGKQRINTLCEFYEDGFTYGGLLYSQMCHRDRHHIMNYRLPYSEIKNATDEQIVKLFIKLNTSGKPMAKEQIEHAKTLIK